GALHGFLQIGRLRMRGDRYDRILAGTALTLVLTFASAHAQPDLLEAKVPLPEQSVVAPPTAGDVTGTAGNSSATPSLARSSGCAWPMPMASISRTTSCRASTP